MTTSTMTIRPRALLSVLVAACVCSLSSTMRAAPPQEAAAVTRFEEGRRAFDTARYDVALKAFEESLSLLPSPNTRLYIARCEAAMKNPASAYTAYKRAAAEASDRMRATGEKRYGVTRDQAISELAEIESKVPRLTLAVAGDAPAGTVVTLDDVEVPRAAWGVAVETDPGPHHVVATGPRRQAFEEHFELVEGQVRRIDVPLTRIPTAALVFHFVSKPSGMEVVLDDRPIDPAGWDKLQEVDISTHTLVARAPGYDDFVWSKGVENGESARIDIALVPAAIAMHGKAAGPPKWVFFSVAGLAVGALSVATVLALEAEAESKEQQALNPLQRDADVQNQIRSRATDANILFVTGSAFAAGAGALAFLTEWRSRPDETASTAVRLSPLLAPKLTGLYFSGEF